MLTIESGVGGIEQTAAEKMTDDGVVFCHRLSGLYYNYGVCGSLVVWVLDS